MKNYSKRLIDVIEYSREEAARLQNSYIGPEHLMLGIIREGEGEAMRVLRELHTDPMDIKRKIEQEIKNTFDSEDSVQHEIAISKTTERVLRMSMLESRLFKEDETDTEHLLLAILKEEFNVAAKVLNDAGITYRSAYNILVSGTGLNNMEEFDEISDGYTDDDEDDEDEGFSSRREASRPSSGTGAGAAQPKSPNDTPVLDNFGTDMTRAAAENRLDPIVGREKEIERLAQILSRRKKNNPVLIGEPGVGKSAIVEGLALRIIQRKVSRVLFDKRVISLDMASIVAGTKYRGQFEERIKAILNELSKNPNIILFIDEIHTIIGAGGSEGAMDASNILKPALARGDFQLIGATTSEEYTKYFEKDAALVRRFQPVRVKEPTVEETITILKGIKHRFEDYHRILVSEDVAEAIASLSDRYISDRFLPDKAIDLLDEACARKRMEQLGSHAGFKKERKEIREIIEKIEAALSDGDITEARELKKEKNKLEKSLERKMKRNQKKQNEIPELTTEDAAEVVSLWTQIPVTQLTKGDMERLRHLEKELHKHVIGQDEAVNAVAKAVKRSRVGLKSPNRPIGSFLFLGPTGVGKTELSKTLAKALFGREEDLIRVDMSEYMEKHSVSKIIGSPPGYVGFGEGGQLSEQIRRHPYSVLLFDEIEKAHPDVFNILLQVLDDGHITDSNGRKVDFKNTVIIMTSNAGANRIIAPKHLGFSMDDTDKAKTHERMKKGVMEEVKQIFRPEFLNRIDETIVFAVLTKEEVKKIAKLFMDELRARLLSEHQITLKITSGAMDLLADKGYDENYGARPLRRIIQNEIEDVLADKILEGTLTNGQTMTIGKKDKKLTFSVKEN